MDMTSFNVGALIFNKELPFVVEVDCDIDDHKFSIRGKGVGNAEKGLMVGKYVVSEGELPCSWSAITHNFQYGQVCFTRYPKDIPDHVKSLFPEGYVQTRHSHFVDDGEYTSVHTLTYENGVIYNRVKVNGGGFKPDGNVFGKRLREVEPDICSVYFPGKDGYNCEFIKLSETVDGDYQAIRIDQVIRPLSDGPSLPMTKQYHHYKFEYSKDANDTREHIIMKEQVHASHHTSK
ncbi:green fluorescent protein-like [Clytia hemisphaerica]|uniref:Green fluorescent protein n=1 Tax=Clytia hemisphaerica TaxID=252671 RepID=A0A7M5TYI8_9CNID